LTLIEVASKAGAGGIRGVTFATKSDYKSLSNGVSTNRYVIIILDLTNAKAKILSIRVEGLEGSNAKTIHSSPHHTMTNILLLYCLAIAQLIYANLHSREADTIQNLVFLSARIVYRV